MKKSDEDDSDKRAVHLGFPNPAMESTDIPLDLNKMIVKNRSSTFYMRVEGSFWEEMDIHSGDILAIDRGLELRSGDIFVGTVDGEFVLNKFTGSHDEEIDLWGVVTYVIHKTRS